MHAEEPVGERHQHSAMHDAAEVGMFLRRLKGERHTLLVDPLPDRADVAEEAVVPVRPEAVGGEVVRDDLSRLMGQAAASEHGSDHCAAGKRMGEYTSGHTSPMG